MRVETYAVDGIRRMTTYRLTLALKGGASNVYTIYGTSDPPLSMPAAFQVDAPFGADIGGVNPGLVAANAAAEFDSWLTVGITDGDSDGALGSIGIDFSSWKDSGLSATNAAVFWMNPDNGPSGSGIAVAQLTIPSGQQATATMGAQGLSESLSDDDWQNRLTFAIGAH